MNMFGCWVSGWCVFARQGPSESEFSISMRYVCFNEVCVLLCMLGEGFKVGAFLRGMGSSESNLRIPMKCVNAMSDDIVVFGSCIIARQGLSESDLSISMRYVFSMLDE